MIGSTFALADDGVIAAGRKEFTFGLGIGPDARRAGMGHEARAALQFAWMTQQKPVFGPTLNAPAALAAALGIDASALRPGVLPQEVNCGSAFFMVPLVSRAAVDQAVVDIRAAAAMFEAAKITRRGLFIFSTEPGADGATCVQPHDGRQRRSRDRIGERAARLLSGEARPGAAATRRDQSSARRA